MAKPEWGTKRVCLNCGARFYDLGRAQIVCPACGTPFDLESAGRAKRARSTPARAAAEVEEAVETDEEAEVEEAEVEDAVEADDDEEEEEEEGLIEDASELGDDDVSDVIDGDIENGGDERG